VDRIVQYKRCCDERTTASNTGRKAERRIDPPAGVWWSEGQTAPGGGDPFLGPFFETALDHVWGGVWNRPGLDLKYRSLVVVAVLAATGHHDELKTHLRGALNRVDGGRTA
jgi:hypothetical protein